MWMRRCASSAIGVTRAATAPDVPDDIKTMMEALGGTIDIDEYR